MYVMYVIPHISNRILDFFWELPFTRRTPACKSEKFFVRKEVIEIHFQLLLHTLVLWIIV